MPQDTSANNKRIAKNTLFLYLRMIMVMGIGLYTVRAILDLLGVVDYGIYNVVGGVVGMFQFLNGTLATSSQRYFSIELAKGDKKQLNKWFCLNITTFSFFILIFLLLAETVGLWFVNTQMTIPSERLFAANVVYQLSVVSFCVSFFNVPYNALIIAHERMNAFAYISIVEAFLKLGIVFVLTCITWDRLIVYGILMFLTSCCITSSYILYNHRHFAESRYRPYWNKEEIANLISFSGWHFLGTISVVVRSECINILINLFFNPAVNAARAIAFQINNFVYQLSTNFFTAVKPQLYKTYALGDIKSHHELVNRSTAVCVFLLAIIVFPFISNTTYILNLWLKSVPEYTVKFSQLVLINGLIDSTSNPAIASVLATGRIKCFQIVVSGLTILNLPLSYVALYYGATPQTTMLISIGLSVECVIARAYYLNKLTHMSLHIYAIMMLRIVGACLLICGIILLFFYDKATTFISFAISSVLIFLITILFFALFVFERSDIKYVFEIIKSKIAHRYL